jgi:hypothetical protein
VSHFLHVCTDIIPSSLFGIHPLRQRYNALTRDYIWRNETILARCDWARWSERNRSSSFHFFFQLETKILLLFEHPFSGHYVCKLHEDSISLAKAIYDWAWNHSSQLFKSIWIAKWPCDVLFAYCHNYGPRCFPWVIDWHVLLKTILFLLHYFCCFLGNSYSIHEVFNGCT